MALPTTMTIDAQRKVRPENQEQKVHPLYDYAFVTDREEGLVVVGPLDTLLDGDPSEQLREARGHLQSGRGPDRRDLDDASRARSAT